MTKRISEYVGAENKRGGDIRSTIENEKQYNIPRPTSTVTTLTTTVNDIDTMLFNIEVDVYVKLKSIVEDNIQKAYSLVLVQCTELPKNKTQAY